MIGHDITCLDTTEGASLSTGGGEREEVTIELNDSFFFGEIESKDCAEGNDCYCKNKHALMSM